MRGHHRFQMHSSPLPIVLFHPSICSPHIMQAEIQQVLTQPAQLRTSVPVPQHIIMKRAPAHQHDTSHFKSGPAPALKLMSPNLSIPSPSPAHGGPVHGCDCFLLAKELRTSLSTQQQRVRKSCRQRGRAAHSSDGPVQLVLNGFVVV